MGYNYSSTARAAELSESVTGSATVLKVSSVAGLPSVPFTVVVDVATESEEVCTVTGVAGLNLTVTRGEDGTAAVPHQVGAVVRHMVVARDLRMAQTHIDAASNVHGIGAPSSVVGTATAQTLTNKTISGANNTFQAVPGGVLNDGSVTAVKLGTGAVQTAKISDLNVTTAKLADGAVTTVKLGDSQVITAKLGDAAVTAPKLASNSVETAKIVDSAVATAKLADGAVTTAKVGDGQITPAKLAAATTGTIPIGGGYGQYSSGYPTTIRYQVDRGAVTLDAFLGRTGATTAVADGGMVTITGTVPVEARPSGSVEIPVAVVDSFLSNFAVCELMFDPSSNVFKVRFRRIVSSGSLPITQGDWWVSLRGVTYLT
jgi:hypothetical protein